MFSWINWNSDWKWIIIKYDFLIKYIKILIEITGILIDIIRIFWFVHFKPDTFLSIPSTFLFFDYQIARARRDRNMRLSFFVV